MSPQLGAVLEAARTLAWCSHCNLSPAGYRERLAAFEALREALRVLGREPDEPMGEELAFLVAAARDTAGQSAANRCGLPYIARRESFARLRGALAVYDAAIRPVTASEGLRLREAVAA